MNLTKFEYSILFSLDKLNRKCFSSLSCIFQVLRYWEGWMRRTRLSGNCSHSRPRSILEMDNEQGDYVFYGEKDPGNKHSSKATLECFK